jgi:hypothetical protein
MPHLKSFSSVSTLMKNFEQPKLTCEESGMASRLARGQRGKRLIGSDEARSECSQFPDRLLPLFLFQCFNGVAHQRHPSPALEQAPRGQANAILRHYT